MFADHACSCLGRGRAGPGVFPRMCYTCEAIWIGSRFYTGNDADSTDGPPWRSKGG